MPINLVPSSSMSSEVFVALPEPVPPATHFRGTALVASLRGLRTRGAIERYFAVLDPAYRETMETVTPTIWVSVAAAVAHYAACDALSLPPETLESIGAEAGTYLNATVLSVALRLSPDIAKTPWGPLSRVETLRERMWRGGAMGVFKLGEAEARLEWHGQPCARFDYFREAMAAYIGSVIGPFCSSLTSRALPYIDDTTCAWQVSWV
jgi:hypothetical protein